jgi:predicted nucleic acid-binding protein
MISVDSNILVALISQNPATSAPAMSIFQKATATGPVYACGAVFSEMLGYPSRNSDDMQEFITTLGIILDWKMEKADWVAAGDAYRGYVLRRQASSGGLPRRMVTDFLIGAHAAVRGYTLLTADRRLYSAAFPNLRMKSF